MDGKILIAYASRYGSTAEVAEFMAGVLRAQGQAVDVSPVAKVTDVSTYQAVMVGSAIRMGAWLPDAVEFVKNNRDYLSTVPTAYFTVCITLQEDTEENRRKAYAFLDPVRAILKPVNEGWFAGKIDPARFSFGDRLLNKMVKPPVGDFRNWAAIEQWAKNVFSKEVIL